MFEWLLGVMLGIVALHIRDSSVSILDLNRVKQKETGLICHRVNNQLSRAPALSCLQLTSLRVTHRPHPFYFP